MKNILIPLVMLCGAQVAQSAVVIDNITPGSNSFSTSISGPDGISGFGFPFPDRLSAFTFTSGPNPGSLQNLEVVFSASGGIPVNSPIVATLSTGNTVPGGTNPVPLGSVTSASGSISLLTAYTQTVPILLAANTQYWVNFTVPPGGTSVYGLQNTSNPTVASGWSLGQTYQQTPFNTAWSSIGGNGEVARVRLTTVPEPASALLGGLASLLLLQRRR